MNWFCCFAEKNPIQKNNLPQIQNHYKMPVIWLQYTLDL